jgi:hypothetical protein
LESLRFEIPEKRIYVSHWIIPSGRIGYTRRVTLQKDRDVDINLDQRTRFTSDIKIRGGYTLEILRLEKPKSHNSKMNKDHWIWRTYEDHCISVVGQHNMLEDHINKPRKQGYVADHVSRPRQ